MKRRLLFTCVLFLFILSTSPAYSQWQRLSTPQIKVPLATNTVIIRGDSMMVGTYRGTVYRSTDGGLNWSRCNNGLSPSLYETYDLLSVNNTVYAATTDGVYVTTDWGSHWTLRNNGFPALYVTGITTLGHFGDTVYAQTPDGGVYVTTNDGKNWAPDAAGLPRSAYNVVVSVNTILVVDSTVFAGTNTGLYRENVSANSWQETSVHTRVNSLSAYGNRIVAAAGNCSASVYYSDDSGVTWQNVSSGMPQNSSGCYISTYSAAVNANEILVGGESGVYYSSDNGLHWKSLNSGISGLPGTYPFVPDIQYSGGQFYAATFQGLYKLDNGKSSWSLLFSQHPETPTFHHTSFLGNNIVTTASANYYNGTITHSLISIDHGSTWKPDTSSLISSFRKFIPIGNKIYGIGAGLYVSPDFGVHWKEIDTGLPKYGINTLIRKENTLYASQGVFTPYSYCPVCGVYGAVYYSTDGGKSWKIAGLKGSPVNSMVVSKGNIIAQIIGSSSLYISKDNGENWKKITNIHIPDSTSFNGLATVEGTAYLGTSHGIYTSSDGGSNWSAFSNGLPKDSSGAYSSVALMYTNNTIPGLSGVIFAVAKNRLFVYQNGLGLWIAADSGLTPHESKITSVTADNNYLYATTDIGIWRIGLSEITSIVKGGESNKPRKVVLQQNYPNPFNPSTTISYQLMQSSFVTLKVYDVLGRDVATLVNKYEQAGKHTVRFNASDLASGIYFYRLTSGKFNVVKKLTVVK